MTDRPNILLIVLDQLRADCLFGALSGDVAMPRLRDFASQATRFQNHYSVTSPCGPSRVSLLTARYAMNHRSVRNGTPVRADIPNLGTVLRSAGYDPELFGYTDFAADPRGLAEDDPRLFTYEGLAPGFSETVQMRLESDDNAWAMFLKQKGYASVTYPEVYHASGPELEDPTVYSAQDSDTAYLADRTIEELSQRAPGWAALVTFLRPHPPLVAPEPYNRMYDAGKVATPCAAPEPEEFLDLLLARNPIRQMAPGVTDLEKDALTARRLRAIYFGLITEVDHHIGRILDWLRDSGQYDDTLIVITADHGEMLGDFGLWGKNTYHDAAFHVPLLIRAPGGGEGAVVDHHTESVDVTPTILDYAGIGPVAGMDGRSLRPFVSGEVPANWKTHSFSELDFGDPIEPTDIQKKHKLGPREANLSVLRQGSERLVYFAKGFSPLLFDHATTGEGVNRSRLQQDSERLANLSQNLLSHRLCFADGTFAHTLITSEGPRTVPP
ncbi:MAG: sulfatase-like hydrolase/transferase [Pseudomonadota bacterium]